MTVSFETNSLLLWNASYPRAPVNVTNMNWFALENERDLQ